MKNVACQVCGNLTISEYGSYEICPVCFWEDDGLYENPDVIRGGPNRNLSLTQARKNYQDFGAIELRLVQYVRQPFYEELPVNVPHFMLVRREQQLPTADLRIIKFRKFKPQIMIFDDFAVDGTSLSNVISQNNPDTPLRTTMFNPDFKKAASEYTQRLLGKLPPDCPSGRTAIYLCPFDGDLQCGAVACRITVTKDHVKWEDFAWDGVDDYSEDVVMSEENEVYTPVKGLTHFSFERSAYEQLLTIELKVLLASEKS